MTSLHGGRQRSRPVRLWWALPTFAVAATAVGAGVVVGPTLGEHVTIPRQLVVPDPSPTQQPPHTATAVVKRHAAPASPTPTPTLTVAPAPSWSPVQQARVVAPRRPVVTASSDDGHERDSGTHENESGDR